MFCKVCFDASSGSYTNHNVKDSAGNVICPLLLNTKCRGCGYFGHTIKYCKKNHDFDLNLNPTLKKVGFDSCVNMTKSNGGKLASSNKNMFSVLNEEIDEFLEFYDEWNIDEDEIIWGIGLKSMIGKKWSDFD